MSSDIGAYTPLKTIVSYALDELDKSMADAEKCWVLALRCLTSLTFLVSGQPITLRLMLSGNKTVPFPPNCLSWSKVGILNSRTEIEALRINEALTTFSENHPNRITKLAPDIGGGGTPSCLFQNFFYNGECYDLYGFGNGIITHGECKVDEAARVIILPPDFPYDSIMFEFIDIPESNYDYQVFTCMQEAVIAFIKWKLKLGTETDYYNAVKLGRTSLPKSKFILQSFNQVTRDSSGFKVRS